MYRTRFRRYTAVAAAYAIALQAMFSAFAASAAVAPPGPAVICQADGSGAPAPVRAHDSCLACLSSHGAGGAGNDDRVAILAPWPVAVPIDAPVQYAAFAPFTPHERRHSPRAPPAG